MNTNRFEQQNDYYRLPKPLSPAITPQGFVMCPAFLTQGLTAEQRLWQWSIYQAAFAHAQEVARPSLPERDLLGVWN
jgi:hypothetical protein